MSTNDSLQKKYNMLKNKKINEKIKNKRKGEKRKIQNN